MNADLENKVNDQNEELRAVTMSINYINVQSSRRGNLGDMRSTSTTSPSILTKPSSADSGEVIYTWYYLTVTSTNIDVTLTSSNLKVGLSSRQSTSVNLYTSQSESAEASIKIPAGKATSIWVVTTDFPSSFFYNLPTNDGQSPTIVGLNSNVLYNNASVGTKYFFTRWNK